MAVNKAQWLGVLLVVGLPWSTAGAAAPPRHDDNVLGSVNATLQGKVMDHTSNSGHDYRIWSRALYQRRDLYVYLPPGFDPHERYPLMIWLHGFGTDETSFLTDVAPLIDDAICDGKLPPLIVAAPDGSIHGQPALCSPGSFWLNTCAGDFEDFVLNDMWDFVVTHYPVRPERHAHILAGVSMGGFAAYNLAIKHRECFGVAVGIFPPLNLRWVDTHGHYFSKFDPKCWSWRCNVDHGHELIARLCGGLVCVRLKDFVYPLFGKGPEAVCELARENPIEMIDRCRLREGELAMYVAYGGKDEFNIDAQVESFLYLAKFRGLTVDVGYDPYGRHNLKTAQKLLPGIIEWLAPRVAPYSPCTGDLICKRPPSREKWIDRLTPVSRTNGPSVGALVGPLPLPIEKPYGLLGPVSRTNSPTYAEDGMTPAARPAPIAKTGGLLGPRSRTNSPTLADDGATPAPQPDKIDKVGGLFGPVSRTNGPLDPEVLAKVGEKKPSKIPPVSRTNDPGLAPDGMTPADRPAPLAKSGGPLSRTNSPTLADDGATPAARPEKVQKAKGLFGAVSRTNDPQALAAPAPASAPEAAPAAKEAKHSWFAPVSRTNGPALGEKAPPAAADRPSYLLTPVSRMGSPAPGQDPAPGTMQLPPRPAPDGNFGNFFAPVSRTNSPGVGRESTSLDAGAGQPVATTN